MYKYQVFDYTENIKRNITLNIKLSVGEVIICLLSGSRHKIEVLQYNGYFDPSII